LTFKSLVYQSLVHLRPENIACRWKYWGDRLSTVDLVTPVLGLMAAGSIIGLRALGLLQIWELHQYDWMMRLRPLESQDPRIVIVGVTEADIRAFNQVIISDQRLAQVIEKINQQSPAVIGLDLYRNVPHDQGYSVLEGVLRDTPHLIGIEKVVDDPALAAVKGNPTLVAADRIAASDLIVDIDGRVRRGFLFPSADGERVIESLGYRVAYEYLAAQQITPDLDRDQLTLAGISFQPVESRSGGYAGTDSGGYQILLNWRASPTPFPQVSVMDILEDRVPRDLLTGRIVMIGSLQTGNADTYYTAYSNQAARNLLPIHGVELHSQLASQIVSTVLDGRPSMQTFPEALEILLILVCAKLGAWIYWLGKTELKRFGLTVLGILSISGGSYGLLMVGWWLPSLPLNLALLMVPLVLRLQKLNQLQSLSSVDELTQLANRRVFKEQLEREWYRALRSQHSLSLIICDVDYFKLYNDTYGHSQGDECLRQVAAALKQAVKRPGDLVARYGGEEFVFLLPNTESEGALALAETAMMAVQTLQIPHTASQVSDYVTVSLGVTSVVPSSDLSIGTLVDTADLGLYEAKRKGRNQTVLRLPWSFG
jgi:adenylate cyclase